MITGTGRQIATAIAFAAVAFISGAWMHGPSFADRLKRGRIDLGDGGETKAEASVHGSIAADDVLTPLWSLTQSPSGPWRIFRASQLIATLDARQCESALLRLRGVDSSLQGDFMPSLLRRWHQIDPAGLGKFAAPHVRIGFLNRNLSYWHAVLCVQYSYLEPKAVVKATSDGLKVNRISELALATMIPPMNAVKAGQEAEIPVFDDPYLNEAMTESFATVIAKQKPALALERAKAIREPGSRALAMKKVFSTWAEKDAPAALATFSASMSDASDSPQQRGIFFGTFESVGKFNPKLAVEEALKLGDGWQSEVAMRGTLTGWAGEDAVAAFEWAAGSGLADFLVEQFPPVSYPSGRIFAGSLVSAAALKDEARTVELVRGVEDAGLRAQLFAEIAGNLSPTTAMAVFAELPPELQRDRAGELAASLAIKSPADAHAWLAAMPDGEPRLRAIEALAASKSEGPGILEAVPAGKERDAALVGRVSALAHRERETALALAAQIADSQQKRRAHFLIATEWLESETAAAAKWLRDTPELPPQTKEFLLRNDPAWFELLIDY